MQFAISHIMILVLLIHAALGCCWHHAHECVSRCCDSRTAVAKACPCESHQHEEHPASRKPHADGLHSEGGNHHHAHDCTGDHCAFVRSDRSPEEFGERSPDATVLSGTISGQQDRLIGPHCTGIPDSSRSIAASSIRSHLLLSILLI